MPPDEKSLDFESALLGKNWSQNLGNFGGSIEFSCQISSGVKGIIYEIAAILAYGVVKTAIYFLIAIPSSDLFSLCTAHR